MFKSLYNLLDKKRRRQLLALLPVMFVGSLLEMLGISLIVTVCSLVVDDSRAVQSAPVALLCRWTGLQPGRQLTAALVGLLIGLYLFKMLYLLVESYALARFSRGFRHEISAGLFSGLLHGPFAYFTQTGTAETINLLQSEVYRTASYCNAFLQAVTEALVMLCVSALLITVNPVMTLFVLLGAALSFVLARVLIRPQALRAGQAQRAANKARLKWMNQGVRGIREVKTWQAEDFFSGSYDRDDWRYARAEAVNMLLSKTPRICIEGVLELFVLLYIVFLLATGGDILLFLPSLSGLVLAALRLIPAFSHINALLTQMSYNRPAVESVCAVWARIRQAKAEAKAQAGPRQELALTTDITARGITFAYDDSPEPVLHDAALEIPIGTSVGIAGPSGAGKTTLINLLLGLLEPQQGAVFADGQDIHTCRSSYLEKIAYLPQSIFLLDDSIRSNVAFGVPPEQVSDAAVWDALERAALAGMVRALPNGLNTPVGEGGVRLSGGECQRLGIARALYRNCPVLFFDESTSALDTETEATVLDAIHALKGEKTVVIVSHRQSVIDGCDRVYRVENGTVRREK